MLIFQVLFRRHRYAGRQLCTFVTLLALLLVSAAAAAQEKSILWRVRSGPNAVVILGSIHFLKKENYPLKKNIQDAADAAQKLVFEIDLQTADNLKNQQVIMEKAVNRDGSTLQQNVSPEMYALAEKKAREAGLDLSALNPFKAWFVALTLTTVALQKAGMDPNYGVDRYLAERASKSGKPISGLETFESQMSVFDGLSQRDQESMLRETLEEMDQLQKSAERIVQAWLTGDTASLEESLLSGMRAYPDLYQRLIVARNRRWLPQIEALIKQGGNALIVVGAAHLMGKDGVIELLKQQGYTVEQL